MTNIYAEWICKVCKGKHRVVYPLIINGGTNISRKMYQSYDVRIEDPTQHQKSPMKGRTHKRNPYAIYARGETPMSTIINVLRNYISAYYTTEENTLKVDICLD